MTSLTWNGAWPTRQMPFSAQIGARPRRLPAGCGNSASGHSGYMFGYDDYGWTPAPVGGMRHATLTAPARRTEFHATQVVGMYILTGMVNGKRDSMDCRSVRLAGRRRPDWRMLMNVK